MLRLQDHVLAMPRYEGVLAIEWDRLPDWLRLPENRHILKSLTRAATVKHSERRLDGGLAGRIGEELSKPELGWIRSVERVTIRPDGVIALRCDFRRPAAWIESGDHVYLVDQDAVRLPGRYEPTECEGHLLPLISGVESPPAAVGQAWPGADLAAGLKVASMISTRPFRSEIRSILVANHDGRRARDRAHLELLTTHQDSRILWGRAPGEEHGTEISARQKLTLLETLSRRWGRIDLGRAYVDIRTYPDSVILPAAGTTTARR